MSGVTRWHLRASFEDFPSSGLSSHPTITESTTGTTACGDSWCDGRCGLPALTLDGLRAFGSGVARGLVFQPFRVPWRGQCVAVTLGELSVDDAKRRVWL